MFYRAALAALLVSTAFADNQVLQFQTASTQQSFQEIATVIRSITEVPEAMVNAEQKSLTIGGTPDQMAAAAWIFQQLEHKATGKLQYKMPGPGDDVIGVFYIPKVTSARQLQEAGTVARSTGHWRKLFLYSGNNAAVVRGTAADIAMAEWIFSELNQPANPIYHAPNSGDDFTRVFYISKARTPIQVQELATVARSIGEIERMFVYSPTNAMVVRGKASEIALAEWLFAALDGPTKRPGADHKMPATNEAVRIMYLTPEESIQRLQEVATSIRKTAQIRRLFTYSELRAIVTRGTPEQLANAERLIAERTR